MPWKVVTITPKKVDMQYTALVYKPAGYILNARTFDATGDLDIRELPYKRDSSGRAGTEESVDLWKIGLIYTGRKPRTISVVALEGGTELGKDTPTVADGDPGGPSRERSISCRVISVRTANRTVYY